MAYCPVLTGQARDGQTLNLGYSRPGTIPGCIALGRTVHRSQWYYPEFVFSGGYISKVCPRRARNSIPLPAKAGSLLPQKLMTELFEGRARAAACLAVQKRMAEWYDAIHYPYFGAKSVRS